VHVWFFESCSKISPLKGSTSVTFEIATKEVVIDYQRRALLIYTFERSTCVEVALLASSSAASLSAADSPPNKVSISSKDKPLVSGTQKYTKGIDKVMKLANTK
jgi:hypothetical protein